MAHYAKFNTSPTHNTLYVLRSMMRQAEVDVSSRKKKRYIAHQIGLLTCTINSHNPPRVSVMKLLLKQCTNILKIRTGLKKSKTFTKYQDLLQSITQACEHLDQLFVNDPTPVIKANCTELIDRSLTLFKQQIPYLGEATPKTCAIQQTQEQLTRLRKKSQDQPQDNSIISEVKHTLQEGKKEFDRHRFLPSKMASTLIRCHRTQAHKITHADITDLITKVDDLNTQRPHATY